MKEKILQKVLAIVLLITLTMTNFILLGFNVVLALNENLEEQEVKVKNSNVEFDAYFKTGETKTHSKEVKIEEGEILYLKLKVKNTGILNDAKILITNSNFKIQKSEIESQYIKLVNEETNEIELNQVIYGNDIELQIPIEFNKKAEISLEDFNMTNNIVLTGKYKETTENEKEIKGEIKTQIKWISEANIKLSQNIDKFIDLKEEETLLQQTVTSEMINNTLPINNQNILVKVPALEKDLPKSISILYNGTILSEDNYKYDVKKGELIIKNENFQDMENQIMWGDGKHEYTIIYLYDKVLKNEEVEIDTYVKVDTSIYTIKKTDIQEISEKVKISKTENIASIKTESTSELYKGYLYGNTKIDTPYEENYDIQISNTNNIGRIEIQSLDSKYISKENIELETNKSTYYTSVKLNKANILDILGTEGTLQILDDKDNKLADISKDVQDKNGYITINFTQKINDIKILTSEPIKIGTLNIQTTKVISANIGHDRETVKKLAKMQSNIKVKSNLSEEIATNEINLLDTKTEANMSINNRDWSTLETNKNIEIIATLKSNSNQYDLYKNPVVQIELPTGIETFKANSINLMYANEELKIDKSKLITKANGSKAIEITIKGEQTIPTTGASDGIKLVINADIAFNKVTPSTKTQLVMNYSNENSPEKTYQTKIDININSKYGLMVYSKISGYNKKQEVIESVDNNTLNGILDINGEKRIATVERTIVNNYDKEISGISIIGNIPDVNESKKSTFMAYLVETIKVSNQEAKIYYSEEGEKWTENVEDISKIKSYKIELPENKIGPKQSIKVSYNILIPKDLKYNESTYESMKLQYENEGQNREEEYSSYLSTKAISESIANAEVLEELEEIGTISINSISAGKELKENEEINEGQTVKNVVRITNNTQKDLTNIKLVAKQDNAIFYTTQEIEAPDTLNGGTMKATYIVEDERITQKEFNMEILKPGETATFEYEFSIKEKPGEETKGTVEISADGIKTRNIKTIKNKIKDADLKLNVKYAYNEEREVIGNGVFPIVLTTKNISDKEIKNIELELKIPEGTKLEQQNMIEENDKYEYTEVSPKIAKLKIDKLVSEESLEITVILSVDEIPADIESRDLKVQYVATANENKYISNVLDKNATQVETDVIMNQIGSISEESLKTGDKLTYTTTIENKGLIDKYIAISDEVPSAAVVNRAYIETNGNITDVEQIEENTVNISTDLKAGQIVTFVVETTIDEEKASNDTISNIVEITGANLYQKSNEVIYKLANVVSEEVVNNSISGIVWLDENQDGERQEKEKTIEDIEVKLINVQTGKFVTNANGEELKEVTSKNGYYSFVGLENGEYIAVFNYDNTQYSITEYKKTGIGQEYNSDVIAKKLDGELVAATDIINIENSNSKNVDAGFVENKIFDLKLDKYINKITVQNTQGADVKQYNKDKFTKIEIDAKRITETMVLIEYGIDITNEGEVPGYVNEIVDYIPDDLTFNSEINKQWYTSTDGNLHTSSLTNEIINPGETKMLTLTLVKRMTEDNTGITLNKAEILKSSNDLSIPDIDSVLGNNVQGEDDISNAETIISIRTGVEITLSIIGVIIMLTTIGIVVYVVRRKGEENNE